MQQINQITQAFPEMLLLYFGEPSTCSGIPDQTQQILQGLIKSSMDITQKRTLHLKKFLKY